MLEIALISLISVASIGPTHMFAIKEGLRSGYKSFFGVLFGGVIVDVLYASLAFYGYSTFGGYNVFKLIALPSGVLVFTFLAYTQIKNWFLKTESKSNKEIIGSPFLTGILMTLPNPFAVIMWATLFSDIKIQTSIFIINIIILTVGLSWIILEGLLVLVFRKYINNNFLKIIEIFTSMLLLYFAIKFGYEFVMLLTQI